MDIANFIRKHPEHKIAGIIVAGWVHLYSELSHDYLCNKMFVANLIFAPTNKSSKRLETDPSERTARHKGSNYWKQGSSSNKHKWLVV